VTKRVGTEVDSREGIENVLDSSANVNGDLLWLLKQAFHHGLYTLNEAIGKHGVATTQLGLMRLLAEHPGSSGAELARRLLVTPQGAQLAINALQRRGYVERRADSRDGRVLRAYLTRAGRQVVNSCVTDAGNAYRELFRVLDDDEQRTFRRLLLKFLNQCVDGRRATENDCGSTELEN
jgi:DNA-binding MarR family transcriptional regulator